MSSGFHSATPQSPLPFGAFIISMNFTSFPPSAYSRLTMTSNGSDRIRQPGAGYWLNWRAPIDRGMSDSLSPGNAQSSVAFADVPDAVVPTIELIKAMLAHGKGISDLVFSPGRPPQV